MTSMTMPSQSAHLVQIRPAATARVRDIRLDFFRGIAMFIILIAHIPSDWLALWIPARFGFSDATEMFVFCSGMASAIAFGAVYTTQGWLTGTARVLLRVWQVYWAHVALFIAVASTTVLLMKSGWFDVDHVARLNLYLFFKNPIDHLPALLTLGYVPNYFDILPMYIVVLAMMPLVMALARVSPDLVVVFVVSVWLAAYFNLARLPAEPLSNRPWFFNPFGWQLIFFTGFAFSIGWIKPPPVDRRLIWLSIAFVVISVPLAYFRIINHAPGIQAWRSANAHWFDKTNFGLLRYAHFLALAYLAYCAVGPNGSRLTQSPGHPALAAVWVRLRAVIVTVGQQSLAVFVFSMFVAVLFGAFLDAVGRTWLSMAWVNALGFAAIAAAAHAAAWFKKKPWQTKGPKT